MYYSYRVAVFIYLQRRSFQSREMSSKGTVVPGKLVLKGRALQVKGGSVKKKKRKDSSIKAQQAQVLKDAEEALQREAQGSGNELEKEDEKTNESEQEPHEDNRTPAERRYLEQVEKIERQRAAKLAAKSHRQRIEDFNKYLADMTEHYDIPKVGPG